MSSYKWVEPQMGMQIVSDSATVQNHQLGLIAGGLDASLGYGEFVYVQGASASSAGAGDWVALSQYSAGQAVSGNTASQGDIAVAMCALSGTGVFGWAQIRGLADNAKGTNASIAAGAPLFIGTGAGRANSTASAAGFRIQGAYCAVSYTSSQSNSLTCYLDYPQFNGQ